MRIGEVCLYTHDVVRLANFYKVLFEIENDCDDDTHQFILCEETTLTVYSDGKNRTGNSQSIGLVFTVDDAEAEFERLKKLGISIIDPPTLRPWGAVNLTFCDPDGNFVTFRSFPKE